MSDQLSTAADGQQPLPGTTTGCDLLPNQHDLHGEQQQQQYQETVEFTLQQQQQQVPAINGATVTTVELQGLPVVTLEQQTRSSNSLPGRDTVDNGGVPHSQTRMSSGQNLEPLNMRAWPLEQQARGSSRAMGMHAGRGTAAACMPAVAAAGSGLQEARHWTGTELQQYQQGQLQQRQPLQQQQQELQQQNHYVVQQQQQWPWQQQEQPVERACWQELQVSYSQQSALAAGRPVAQLPTDAVSAPVRIGKLFDPTLLPPSLPTAGGIHQHVAPVRAATAAAAAAAAGAAGAAGGDGGAATLTPEAIRAVALAALAAVAPIAAAPQTASTCAYSVAPTATAAPAVPPAGRVPVVPANAGQPVVAAAAAAAEAPAPSPQQNAVAAVMYNVSAIIGCAMSAKSLAEIQAIVAAAAPGLLAAIEALDDAP